MSAPPGVPRLGTGHLLARHLRSAVAPSLLVALLVFAVVLGVASAPRALLALGDEELRVTLGDASPALLDLTGSGTIGLLEGVEDATVDRLLGPVDDAVARFPDSVPLPLRDALGEARWISRTPAADVRPPDGVSARVLVSLAVDLQRDDLIRYVDGEAPAAWPGRGDDDAAPVPIEVAISAGLAEELGVGVGDVVESDTAPLRVSAVYEAADPGDAAWVHASDLAAPVVDQPPGQLRTVRASVFVDPLTVAPLATSFIAGRMTGWVPVDPSVLRYSDAADLQRQSREVIATRLVLPYSGSLDMRTGLADAIDRIVGRVSAASALLALVGSGLFGVLLAVLALGVRAILQRREPAIALALARGGSPLQVRIAMLLEGALVTVPAAALGTGLAALLLPVDAGTAGWLLPLAVGLVVTALFPALTPTRASRPDRSDLRSTARSPRRWVLEVAVVGLAVVSVVLLQRRGLVGTSAEVGIDPLLAAMPVLLAAAVGVVVLRLYPAPMLGVQALARRGDSATALVGAARAVRDPALGFPAVLALVVGVAVVVSTITLAATTRAALAQAAIDGVGADVRVQAAAVTPDLVARLAAEDGVEAAVGVAIVEGVRFDDEVGDDEVFLVLADTSALHAVRGDLPELDPGAEPVPMFVSVDWADRIVGEELRLARAPARSLGTLPADAIPGVTRHWVLADVGALERFDLDPELTALDQVLVRLDAGADVDAVAARLGSLAVDAQPSPAAASSVTVRTVAGELAEATAAPTVGRLEGFLLLAAGAALALTLLAVLLASITSASSRGRMLAILRVLGLSRRQVRRLLAWELAPVALTATLVGTGLGLALPILITAVLDLRPFVGGRDQPGAALEPLWIAAGVGIFLLTVVVAGIVAAAVSRRIAPAGALKMGDA